MSLLLFIKTTADLELPITDVLLGTLLGLGLIRGFIKGFVVELTSLLALILGIYGAIHFSYFMIELLKELVSWPQKYINITAFILTFIIIVIGISLLGSLMTKLTHLLALGLLNHLLGAVFGLLKTAFILSIFLMFFTDFNSTYKIVEQKRLDSSALYTPLVRFGEKLLPSVMHEINEHSVWDKDFY